MVACLILLQDTFSYNGLGLRVGKQDSTGSYSYLCDGASAGSAVLWDGQAVYTAGLSERRGGVSSYFDFDRLGNLWTVDGSAGAVQLYYQDTTGFGGVIAAAGNVGTPFRFGGGSGCQTDADIGLVLMGHRYYDTRIGRFISQDPAGDGDNWYAYCGNDPVDGSDPSGLLKQAEPLDGGLLDPSLWPPGWSLSLDPNSPPGMDGDVYRMQGIHIDISPGGNSGDVTGPADANNLGFGGFVDNNVTFGTVGLAARTAGMYDAGKTSRAAVIGTIALAGVAIVGAALSDGEDAAAVDATRPLANVAKEELLSRLNPKALRELFGQGRKGAEAALNNLPHVEGITKDVLEAYKEIAYRQIEKGFDSSGVHAARIRIIEQMLGRM